MKKVLFTIFAVLFMMPVRSSAATCEPQPDTNLSQPENALKTTNNQWLYCGGTTATNCADETWVLGFDNRIYECSDNKWSVAKITTDCRPYDGNIFYHDGRTFRNAPYYSYILNDSTEQIIGFTYSDDDKIKIERACYVPLSECHSGKKSVAGVCETLLRMPVWGQSDDETPAIMYATASDIKTSSKQYVSTANQPVLPTTPASDDTLDLSECENSGGEVNNQDHACTCDTENKYLESTTEVRNNKTYSICKCIAGYKRKTGQYTDDCVDAGDTVTEQVLDTEKMRAQAEAAYQSARDHEQSIANRALTAGTTLTTGLGAMAAASALAEQNADREAESAMRDYLATFKCEYGNGQQQNAGNEEITLPGGNELLEYYSEYKTLADNVKQTKGALGLRAGIESETLYDRAQTGLYQYSTAARTSTGQISLARALSDETSADAAAWNEQKAQTASNLKTGLVATATGVVSGIVGNQLINRKYRPEELKDEFTEITHRLEREYPQTFMPEPIEIKSKTDAITMPEQTKQAKEQLKLNIPPVSGTAFEEADFELNTEGKKGLDAAITQIINTMNTIPNSIISIHTIGHTDMLGISAQTQKNKGYKTNQELSEKRSATVSNYLKNGLSKLGDRVRFYMPTGQGDTWCRQQNKAKDDGDCRRVDIDIKDLTIYE